MSVSLADVDRPARACPRTTRRCRRPATTSPTRTRRAIRARASSSRPRRPVHRRRLLRQGRRRRDGDARAQRFPDARGGDRRARSPPPTRAQRPAAAARIGVPDRRGRHRLRRARPLFNAFVDVANKPQDASARQVALARIGDLAARFRTASDQLDSLQSGVALDLETAVKSVNSLTQQIAEPEPADRAARAPATRRTTCSTSATRRSTT